MPLELAERDFLEAYVYEATNGPPFGGPATSDLRRRGIYYSDLSWLLTAYQRELAAEGKAAIGISNPAPPPSPWQSLDEVKRRSQILKTELEGHSPHAAEMKSHV
jgi:hypothetical protein